MYLFSFENIIMYMILLILYVDECNVSLQMSKYIKVKCHCNYHYIVREVLILVAATFF
jgi:hypothetical protein